MGGGDGELGVAGGPPDSWVRWGVRTAVLLEGRSVFLSGAWGVGSGPAPCNAVRGVRRFLFWLLRGGQWVTWSPAGR